jgi:hypothetical protein
MKTVWWVESDVLPTVAYFPGGCVEYAGTPRIILRDLCFIKFILL